MALSRDAILGAVDVQTEKVPVKEWGDDVIVRGLTGEELDAYQASIRQLRPRLDGKGMEPVMIHDNMRAKLLVKCLVDEAGERLFTDKDVAALGAKNGKVLDRLYDVAAALSGLSEEEQEEMEGNSDPAESAGSTSSSPDESSTAP
ncbi:hypothetical protein [Streptomyces sp. NPDC058108]|uniref:hypothetical protein n=1 Tax=Streptomyces sp. NPDC058108 TaxID=3346344 RepID=UPI0036E2FBAC